MHYRIWRNRSRHNRPSADHGVSTDRNSGEDGGIGPDRTTFLKRGSCKTAWPLSALREEIVCKSRVWANEDIAAHAQAVPELHARLHRHAISKDDIVLYENMIANVAILAYDRARQNVRERPHLGSVSDFVAFADTLRVNEMIHYNSLVEFHFSQDDGSRSFLRIFIDSPDVRSHDPETDQINTSEESNR